MLSKEEIEKANKLLIDKKQINNKEEQNIVNIIDNFFDKFMIEKAKETMEHWVKYEEKNKDKINRVDDLIGVQKTLLQYIDQLEQENKTLKQCLIDNNNNKDINEHLYLGNTDM